MMSITTDIILIILTFEQRPQPNQVQLQQHILQQGVKNEKENTNWSDPNNSIHSFS